MQDYGLMIERRSKWQKNDKLSKQYSKAMTPTTDTSIHSLNISGIQMTTILKGMSTTREIVVA